MGWPKIEENKQSYISNQFNNKDIYEVEDDLKSETIDKDIKIANIKYDIRHKYNNSAKNKTKIIISSNKNIKRPKTSTTEAVFI